MDSEYDEDGSFQQKGFKDLNASRGSHFQRQTFRNGGGSGFPKKRVVLLSLGLLDTALLIAALVLGIYCAKAKDFQHNSGSALAPLIIERNFLRNHSDVIKERLVAQLALEKQHRTNTELQIQVKQQQTITDSLQSLIEVLRTEKAQLEINKTELESNCGRCPLGWILLKTSCYYYSVPPTNAKKNWSESRADCISRGGDLIVINNLEEQKIINNNYPRIPGTSAWWQMGFWIGLTTNNVTNDAWVWVNNATEDSTMYWRTDQPSKDVSLGRNCAALGRSILSWRSWYNRNCENDQLNWICEREPQ